MLLELQPKEILVVIHLFGIALGAGGAFTSDAMFIKSIWDLKISTTEFSFLRLGSLMVWIGVAVLAISGFMIFLLDPEFYLAKGRFLSKMTVVAIIIANGVVFHTVHIPLLKKYIGNSVLSSDEFVRKSKLLLASGVLSSISWSYVIVLGALSKLSYSYGVFMLVYIVMVSSAVLVALLARSVWLSRQ